MFTDVKQAHFIAKCDKAHKNVKNKVGETMLKLLEALSDKMMDDDAVSGTSPPAGETLLQGRKSPSVENDAREDPHAKARRKVLQGKIRANDSRSRGYHNVFKHFPKDPNCDVYGMSPPTTFSSTSYCGPQNLELRNRLKQ